MPKRRKDERSLDSAVVIAKAAELVTVVGGLAIHERVEVLNHIRMALHRISPFRDEPVDCVQWVPLETVAANDYNPNSVAPPEMQLLEYSIKADGYTQPIVTFFEGDTTQREVVDGFHRNRVGRECTAVKRRVRGYLPVVTINQDRADRGDRIAATIRHNRARGKHQVQGMSDIVVELKRRNWSDEKIGRELGMDPDEVLRLAQISGLAEMFKDREFSEAWEAENINEINEVDTLEIMEEAPPSAAERAAEESDDRNQLGLWMAYSS
jgi:ParB-like chromosome segregation protein Spo0J